MPYNSFTSLALNFIDLDSDHILRNGVHISYLWRADCEKPMSTGHKQGEMQLDCFFLRCLSVD
jgi:hypothetical protein